jgi:hypothetical protein
MHLTCASQPFSEYLIMLLYRSYKSLAKTLDSLTELLKDFELKTAKDTSLITKTSERLNSFYMLKYNSDLLHFFLSKIPITASKVWSFTGVLGESALM